MTPEEVEAWRLMCAANAKAMWDAMLERLAPALLEARATEDAERLKKVALDPIRIREQSALLAALQRDLDAANTERCRLRQSLDTATAERERLRALVEEIRGALLDWGSNSIEAAEAVTASMNRFGFTIEVEEPTP
jgi:hypothetical protein